MELIWVTHPDNYDPDVHRTLKSEGNDRIALFTARGYHVRVAHVSDLVPGWDGRPRLWWHDEDLLATPRGFMFSTWAWDSAAAAQVSAILTTVRASGSVVLNDAIDGPAQLADDKLAMYHHAGGIGVPVLPTIAVPFGRYARRVLAVARALESPGSSGYVLKPRDMAMGYGVLRCATAEQLASAVDLIAPGGLGCIVQPFHEHSADLRVFVRRGKVIGAMHRSPVQGNELANISRGANPTASDVADDMAELSTRLADSVDAEYLCVDWLLAPAGPIFNEWMTVSAGFEDLPEPDRSRVADALLDYIADRLGPLSAR